MNAAQASPAALSALADTERLAALAATGLLDSPAEPAFDRLTRMAARLLGVPVCLVSLVDDHRQFFKSAVGLTEPWASCRETPLSHSFCRYVVATSAPLLVADARQDPLLCDNLAIRDLGVIAYLGIPLCTPDGQTLGSFCAIDSQPRAWTPQDQAAMSDLAACVMSEIALRQLGSQGLQAVLARHEAAFENAAVGMALIATDGRFLRVNDHLCTLVGYSREELLARTFADVTHPEDVPAGWATARVLLAGEAKVHATERRYLCRDGSVLHGALSVSLVRRPDGTPDYFIVVVRDIGDRVRAEQALRDSEQELRTMFEASSVGMIQLDAASGRVMRANPAFCAMLGYAEAELMQRTPAEITHPDDREADGQALGRLLRGEIAQFEREKRMLRADGSPVWVQVKASLIRDAQGRPLRTVAVVEDIGARREAEDRLRQSGDEQRALNQDLSASRLAALNLMEDAERARHEAEAAAAALREREAGERARRAELEVLMAALPVAVFIAHDPQCARITANTAGMALLRLAAGANASVSAPEAERPSYRIWSGGRELAPGELPMQRAAATGQVVADTVLDIVFPDGTTRHALGSALPLFDDAGAVRGCIGAFVDITGRQRHERNLALLAEIQQAFAPLAQPAEIVRVARERIARHLQLDGCQLLEIDDVADQAIVLGGRQALTPEGQSSVRRISDFVDAATRERLASGHPVVVEDVCSGSRSADALQRYALAGVRSYVGAPYVADGSWKFLLAATRGQPSEWPGEDVELLAELAARIGVRIERARAAQSLRESEERLRLAADAAHFGMYDRDLRSSYFHVSAQLKQLLGYEADAALDHATVMSHFHPDDRAAGVAAFQRAVEPGGDGRIVVEQRVVRRDGEVRWIESVGRVLFEDGQPVRSLGFWVDISDRKAAELALRVANAELEHRVEERTRDLAAQARELERASRVKSEFLANMSHELRTPLNSLLILSRLLADNREHNLLPKQIEYASTIHQSGSDLLSLINEILDLSKIEAGQMEVFVETVPLAELCEKVERQFRPVAQARHLGLQIRRDPALPASLRSDGRRLEQVLRNLLSNAFKFTEQGSVVLELASATGGWHRPHPTLDPASGVIAFRVIDSGIGIEADKQQLIFEAFQQVDGTTSRKYGGTGLGLSICREIASLLGGAIVLESSPGAGSTFTLYLPLAYAPRPPAAGGPALLAPPRPAGAARIELPAEGEAMAIEDDDRQALAPGEGVLLVDGDAAFAGVLLDFAHRQGLKGLIATRAAQALELARAYRPIAMTLSFTLPDMDGWHLLERIKSDLAIRHIPVHVVSGQDERPRGQRQGAASWLQKPVTEEALDRLFERIAASRARAPARLLLVEDDALTQREILAAFGESEALRATCVASAEQALAWLRDQACDCVVLDLRLPGMSGLDFLEAVRDQLHLEHLPIVVYTAMTPGAEQQRRLQHLAESVLLKDARSISELVDISAKLLHLPLKALPDAARETVARWHESARSLAGKKLLVVDDDMRNVYAVLAILEAEGMEVRHAENGQQCLDMLEAAPDVDAVLIDIMMPVMDGYETMRRLRRMKGLDGLPVIALTAKVMPGDREKCMEAGASDYLAKPVDAEHLLAMLRRWLYRDRTERQ